MQILESKTGNQMIGEGKHSFLLKSPVLGSFLPGCWPEKQPDRESLFLMSSFKKNLVSFFFFFPHSGGLGKHLLQKKKYSKEIWGEMIPSGSKLTVNDIGILPLSLRWIFVQSTLQPERAGAGCRSLTSGSTMNTSSYMTFWLLGEMYDPYKVMTMALAPRNVSTLLFIFISLEFIYYSLWS